MLNSPALPIRRPLAWLAAIATATLASLAIASSAQAGVLVASAPNCSDFETSQPFMPWADPSEYILDPGGSFEGGADGWALNGAEVGSGNEPYYANEDGGTSSLHIGSGDSATSSTICVGLEHPTLRFFARNSGSPLATMRVSVRFEDAYGDVHSLPIGLVTGGGGWQPTLPMVVTANLLPLLPGNYTPVQFRFTPQGGDWKIDDVFVDPKRGG
jgi:hypothetical protein